MGLLSRSCLLLLLLLDLLVPAFVQGACANNDHCVKQPDCDGCALGDKVPDPTNCHGYHYCEGGGSTDYNPLLVLCPNNQVFDTNTRDCVLLGTCEQCPSVCVYDCLGYEDRRISSPDDCNIYYECEGPTASSSVSCPDSAPFFDGITCQNDETRCCRCRLYCDSANNKFIIDPLDCRKFWLCSLVGIPTEGGTCPDGENFDATLQDCSASAGCKTQCSNAVGPDGCIDPFTCETEGFFAKCPEQCTSEYYHCEEATGEYDDVVTCPTGTVFHPDSHICVAPDDCPYT